MGFLLTVPHECVVSVETQRRLLANNGKASDTGWETRLIKNMVIKKDICQNQWWEKVFLKQPIAKLKLLISLNFFEDQFVFKGEKCQTI